MILMMMILANLCRVSVGDGVCLCLCRVSVINNDFKDHVLLLLLSGFECRWFRCS